MDAGTKSMIDNLKTNTGRSLQEWFAVLEKVGSEKHSELMNHLKSEHGVSHGFANGIPLQFRERNTERTDDEQYSGNKSALRPIYDPLAAAMTGFGPDVEVATKRTGVSFRRSKQFALIEPASSKRLQLGINLKGTSPTERLLEAGGMCTHKVSVTSADEVDDELTGWLREAYERA